MNLLQVRMPFFRTII